MKTTKLKYVGKNLYRAEGSDYVIRKAWDDHLYVLVDEKTGEAKEVGEEIVDFRGDREILMDASAPHKPGAAGYVYTQPVNQFAKGRCDKRSYVSVWNLCWALYCEMESTRRKEDVLKTETKFQKELKKVGATLIEIRPFSDNPGDDHLSIVLCKLKHNDARPFVTWYWNDSSGGFNQGHYFKDVEKATADFKNR